MRRSRRHPPGAPRSHSKEVMFRRSSRMPPRVNSQNFPRLRWKTSIRRLTSVTARVKNNRVQSPAPAQAGNSTRGYRPGSGGARAITYHSYPARQPTVWVGSPLYVDTRGQQGRSPGGSVSRGPLRGIDKGGRAQDTHKAIADLTLLSESGRAGTKKMFSSTSLGICLATLPAHAPTSSSR